MPCLIPTTIWYEYKRTGQFTVRASGQGNCDGQATTTVRVTAVRPQAEPAHTAAIARHPAANHDADNTAGTRDRTAAGARRAAAHG
jgi:hypothetical protein